MPLVATLGTLSARAFGFGGGLPSAGFIGSTNKVLANGANTITLPSGTQVGDLLVVVASDYNIGLTSISGAGATWSTPTYTPSGNTQYAYGVCGSLTSVTANTNVATECAILLVFRGPTALAYKTESNASTGSTRTAAGFTKAGGSKVILTSSATYGNGITLHQTCSTSGFVSVAGPVNKVTLDVAYCAAAAYTNGTGIVWSATNGTASDAVAYELT